MEQLNQVKLIGIIGHSRVSEIADRMLVNFTVATNNAYKDHQGIVTVETTWHNCVYWTSKGDTAPEKIRKGSPVSLIGRLRTHRYTGSDGVDRTTTEIVLREIDFPAEQPTTEISYR